MLSYQHGYHAGNFADVHKHTALCLLTKHLSTQPGLITYLDSHAGRGLYDLSADQSQKTSEWKDGIARFENAPPHTEALSEYLSCVREFGDTIYPGSPKLIQQAMAPNHRGIFFELHPTEHGSLVENFAEDRRITIHQKDAFTQVLDYLPARKQTGLLLIDPPYEIKDDYMNVARLVKSAHKRWPSGIIVVWYPILPEGRHTEMINLLKGVTTFELTGPKKERGMYGTGLAIYNAPEGFHDTFSAAEKEMQERLFG